MEYERRTYALVYEHRTLDCHTEANCIMSVYVSQLYFWPYAYAFSCSRWGSKIRDDFMTV